MTERKLKPLAQILNENEIEFVSTTKRGKIYHVCFKGDYHFHLAEYPNCGPFPDNFYEEEECLELKTLDEIKGEFFHKIDRDGDIEFQIKGMETIVADMFPVFGRKIAKSKFVPGGNEFTYEGVWTFDKRWFR